MPVTKRYYAISSESPEKTKAAIDYLIDNGVFAVDLKDVPEGQGKRTVIHLESPDRPRFNKNITHGGALCAAGDYVVSSCGLVDYCFPRVLELIRSIEAED